MGLNKRKREVLVQSDEFVICPYCNYKYKEADLVDVGIVDDGENECVICSKIFSLEIEEHHESKLYYNEKMMFAST